jgi:hypothetical protein
MDEKLMMQFLEKVTKKSLCVVAETIRCGVDTFRGN